MPLATVEIEELDVVGSAVDGQLVPVVDVATDIDRCGLKAVLDQDVVVGGGQLADPPGVRSHPGQGCFIDGGCRDGGIIVGDQPAEHLPGGLLIARLCHPREEHLLPLMVAAGAAEGAGARDYGESVLGGAVSAFRFA